MSRQVKAPAVEPYKKIVVALGGKLVNPAVVHEAVRIARLSRAKLIAVHIRYPRAGKPTMMMDKIPEYDEESIRDHFRKRGYRELGDSVTVEIYDGTNSAKVLARVTKGADLLVVSHVQRNRIVKALSGTPPNVQLMDVVQCPVLIVPKKRTAPTQKK